MEDSRALSRCGQWCGLITGPFRIEQWSWFARNHRGSVQLWRNHVVQLEFWTGRCGLPIVTGEKAICVRWAKTPKLVNYASDDICWFAFIGKYYCDGNATSSDNRYRYAVPPCHSPPSSSSPSMAPTNNLQLQPTMASPSTTMSYANNSNINNNNNNNNNHHAHPHDAAAVW